MHIEDHSILHHLHRHHIITVTKIIVANIIVDIMLFVLSVASLLIAFCRRFDFVSNSTKYPSGKNHGTRTSTQKTSILDPPIIIESASDSSGL